MCARDMVVSVYAETWNMLASHNHMYLRPILLFLLLPRYSTTTTSLPTTVVRWIYYNRTEIFSFARK